MKQRFAMILFFIILFILLVDLYSFKGIKLLVSSLDSKLLRTTIYLVYWAVPFILVSFLVYFRTLFPFEREPGIFKSFYILAGFFILFYIPKLFFIVFHLTEDILTLIKWFALKLKPNETINTTEPLNEISRAKFITQIGLIIAAIPFTSILFGMAKGRFNFRISHERLYFQNLPESFNHLKIVQISDIHIGSFLGHEEQVIKAIELINEQHPDIILFTGDLVNNFAEELNGWIPILSRLEAKYGKYSILGNHDYGDYFEWKNEAEKEQNLEKIKKAHAEIGFKLLLNEFIALEKENTKIELVGVENWGLPPFPQYGNLKTAMNGTNGNFKILMSHDPSHWDAEVIEKTDIDLTLSGHTHGMQFGIEIGNIKWSPVKYKYPRWAGLYQVNNQYLYVNRGFGYIGFPGRVGMPPEITVLELFKA
ncbi:MAG TPA: metallophosphoesterase [Bacteroidales bacterium]|nr:metallophosphoesterase [Bacteroidales bacterium]